MSKELVISSNRHETKVAILEDDQLVEVYFQRANEYSLAGSVHKGRVTRVLPGMQSAFVDLGLDRDTFLYVSDFFEENEDYDRIEGGPNPTSNMQARPERGERGGDRGDRGDRGERGDRRDRPERGERAPLPAPIVEEVTPAALETQPETAAVSQTGEAVPPRPAGEDGDRDRRGRRSRRRRRGSRGFPDSKYASAADTQEETPGAAEEAESDVDDASDAQPDMQAGMRIVLPGESLAKYKAPRQEAGPAEAEDDDNGVPPGMSAIPDENPEEQPPVNAMPDAPVHEHVHGAGAATAPESIPHPKPLAEEPVIEEPAPDAAVAEAGGETEAAETENDSVPEAFEGSDVGDDPEIRALILDSDGDLIEPSEEGEAPAAEGEQKTQSASVREQSGGRYLQRGRRMRGRRSRGQQSGEQPAPFREPRPEVRPDVRPDVRPEVRSEPRAETHPEHRAATRPERAPMPSITDLLKEGQEILVQIAKEPLGQKGARITSHIALPGRFVVYMPTLDHMGVSRKIASDDERLRLKKILQKHRVGVPGGYIIRTAGEGKTEDEISSDMLFLANLWLDIRQKAEKRPAPLLLHHDLDIVQRILRDQVNDNFKSMWVDNEEMYESILRFLQRFQPTMVSRVKLYTRPAPIFDAFNVTNELEKALRPKVWLKSGGYIVINQTEALVAIDINTGKYVGKSNRLEDTIVKTNTEAVKEIVRQIRLRDLGGIIVIDFIDMDERKNRQKVMQALEDAMRSDRAPNKILQFNDFGLVAITRKRVKQSLERTLCAPCPYCEGAGYVKSVQTIIGEILQEAQKIARAVEGSNNVMLRVHPDVAKLLKSNENHYLEELEEILKRPVLVTSDAAIHHEKFDLA